MATNPPKGPRRKGAVKDRTQFYNPLTDRWQKRDKDSGQIMDVKVDGRPFKGITKEKRQ